MTKPLKILHLEGCGRLTSTEYKQTKRDDSCIIYQDINGHDKHGIIKKFEASCYHVFAITSTLKPTETLAPHIQKFQ